MMELHLMITKYMLLTVWLVDYIWCFDHSSDSEIRHLQTSLLWSTLKMKWYVRSLLAIEENHFYLKPAINGITYNDLQVHAFNSVNDRLYDVFITRVIVKLGICRQVYCEIHFKWSGISKSLLAIEETHIYLKPANDGTTFNDLQVHTFNSMNDRLYDVLIARAEK